MQVSWGQGWAEEVAERREELPFADGTDETVIIATGVIDFMADLQQIETVLRDANR